MIPDACTSISGVIVISPNDDIDAAFDASMISLSICAAVCADIIHSKKKTYINDNMICINIH